MSGLGGKFRQRSVEAGRSDPANDRQASGWGGPRAGRRGRHPAASHPAAS